MLLIHYPFQQFKCDQPIFIDLKYVEKYMKLLLLLQNIFLYNLHLFINCLLCYKKLMPKEFQCRIPTFLYLYCIINVQFRFFIKTLYMTIQESLMQQYQKVVTVITVVLLSFMNHSDLLLLAAVWFCLVADVKMIVILIYSLFRAIFM